MDKISKKKSKKAVHIKEIKKSHMTDNIKETENNAETPEAEQTPDLDSTQVVRINLSDLRAAEEKFAKSEKTQESDETENTTEADITADESSDEEDKVPDIYIMPEPEIKHDKKSKKRKNRKKDKSSKPGKRRMSVANIIFRIVLLLIAVGLVFWGIKALISLSVQLKPEIVENAVVKEIPVTTTGTLAYDGFQRGVIVANNGSVSYYNSKAELLWEQAGFDGSPVIDVCGRYALVSYTGTPNALLFNGPGAIPITGNGNIVTACVNENGYFALVMTEEGYKNQIVVFDNNGQVIYRWHSAENYITCVSVAPDNEGMTASTVNFSGNSFAGSVLVFDFAQDKPYTGSIENDNLVMDIEYVSDNRIVVIGDSFTSYYKTNGTKISDIDYKGKKLTTFDVCRDGHTILCFSKDDSVMSNSDVYSYTSKGKQMGHFETDGRGLSVSCNEGHILIARERQFDILSEKCKKESTKAVVKDIKNSVLFDKGRYAFSISGNSAQVIKVR